MAVSVPQIVRWKQEGRPISVLTAWDYISGQIADQAGADMVLVGDSLAMVVLGHANTLSVTLDEMLHHTRAVRRGVQNALVILDLPFLSYQTGWQEALHSAGRAIKEASAHGVKLEGGHETALESIKRLVQAGIPVMGHVGLTPQSINQLGGFRKQGKSAEEGDRILHQAQAVEAAGAFSIVLEHIPAKLGEAISKALTIPTIGIGAGPQCDGQVLVTTDILGLSNWQPPFAKVYVNLQEQAIQAARQFCEEVRSRQFPSA